MQLERSRDSGLKVLKHTTSKRPLEMKIVNIATSFHSRLNQCRATDQPDTPLEVGGSQSTPREPTQTPRESMETSPRPGINVLAVRLIHHAPHPPHCSVVTLLSFTYIEPPHAWGVSTHDAGLHHSLKGRTRLLRIAAPTPPTQYCCLLTSCRLRST